MRRYLRRILVGAELVVESGQSDVVWGGSSAASVELQKAAAMAMRRR